MKPDVKDGRRPVPGSRPGKIRRRFRRAAALAAIEFLVCAVTAPAVPVRLTSVEASYCQDASFLPYVIDGVDTGRPGWAVLPHLTEHNWLIVRTATPIEAQAFDLTMCFLSGWPGRYPGDFTISYTTDPKPALFGNWQRVVPERYSATGPELTLGAGGHFHTGPPDEMVGDAIIQVRFPGPPVGVTGFRIDVYPFVPSGQTEQSMSWSEYRDFRLTEFRVDAIKQATTNIALGKTVTASHPLWADASPNVLTDGLPGSFNHPAQPGLGTSFYFQIDLVGVHRIDHIALKSRADGAAMERMSRVLLQLYKDPPGPGVKPAWEAMDRADGSFPEPGAVDIVKAKDGRGTCEGRYLRLSSDSKIALSPQFAEVEVYPTLSPRLRSLKVDGTDYPLDKPILCPPGTRHLLMEFSVPGSDVSKNLTLRWRLRGLPDDWRTARNLVVEIDHPPSGEYVLEASVQHTDGQWDASALTLPVTVELHFWRKPSFFWLSLAGVVVLGAAVARRVATVRRRRREATQAHKMALEQERSRIARDMHDEVGGRLAQIAMMQELLTFQCALPPDISHRLKEIAGNTHLAVEALDQVVWTVNPSNDTLRGLVEYLSHIIANYLGPLEISYRLDIPAKVPNVEIRAHVRHHLVKAFQEALQNIIKHSEAKMVNLSISICDSTLELRLVDDGKGLPDEPGRPGRSGLKNMRDRLEMLGGQCRIEAAPGRGTLVEFKVSLIQSP